MLNARIVLDDCRYAHRMLDSVLDEQRFRIYWAASLSLLRAVGHVLKEVDRKRSPRSRAVIDAAWTQWDQDRGAHPLFWEFIKAERDLVLKQYAIRLEMGGVEVLAEGPDGAPVTEHLSAEYYVPVTDGHFADHDARELVRDAIHWWDDQLEAIERQMAQS